MTAGAPDPTSPPPPCPFRELLQLPFAENRGGSQRVAPLGDRRRNVVSERMHEAPELGQIRQVIAVRHAGKLDSDDDGATTGRIRLGHRSGGS